MFLGTKSDAGLDGIKSIVVGDGVTAGGDDNTADGTDDGAATSVVINVGNGGADGVSGDSGLDVSDVVGAAPLVQPHPALPYMENATQHVMSSVQGLFKKK